MRFELGEKLPATQSTREQGQRVFPIPAAMGHVCVRPEENLTASATKEVILKLLEWRFRIPALVAALLHSTGGGDCLVYSAVMLWVLADARFVIATKAPVYYS